MELIIVDLSKEEIDINTLYDSLPIQIKEHVDRYKIKEDKIISIVAWDIVNKKIDLKTNPIKYNDNGKPFLKNYYFSITHSHNLVGVLFDEKECGLDIELINKRYDKLASKIINQKELDEYIKNPDILINKWTKIEAYSKGMGTGFRFDFINNLPNNIDTKEIQDTLNNKYYYSIWIKE